MKFNIILRQLGLAVDESKATEDGWLTINAPHRKDSNPSFAVNIQHGGWKDNATGESGNIYALVQLVYPSMGYREAKEFVDGKSPGKPVTVKKPDYYTSFNHSFWDAKHKDMLKTAQARLKRSEKCKALKDLKHYDGVSKETAEKFGCGLVDWRLGGEEKEALLIPYPSGAQIYARGQEGKQIRMIPGSKPSDSFFGASQLSKNKQLLITKSPREAMLADQELGSTFDVLGTCTGETDKLSEQQANLLKDKARYWRRVFVSRDRDTLPAEKQAFGFARNVCDAIGTFNRDIRLCNIGKLTGGECKDLTDLYKSTHQDKVGELFSEKSYQFSEYIWNNWTEKYNFAKVYGSGGPVVNEVDFARILGEFGFKKSYLWEADEPTLVRDVNNILHNVSSHQLSDFVLEEILDKFSRYVDTRGDGKEEKLIPLRELQKVFFKYRDKVLSKQIKAIFRPKQLSLLTDRPSSSFLFYSNSAVKVTKDDTTMIDYKDLEGKIWEPQIMGRSFAESCPEGKGDLEHFVENVASGEPNKKHSFMSALGYLLHTYKNKASSPAIILVDEKSTPEIAQGGTGKSLFAQSIKHIRAQRYIAGKNVDPSSRFFLMDAKLGDQSLFCDDVREDFDFEALFNVITDDMQVEAKFQNRFTIPFEVSPKIILATNSVVKGFGNSFKRRQFTLPFSDHYLKNPVPQKEFGRRLFEDWDEAEWMRYDHYMIRCLQLYLTEGLIPFPTNYHLVRGLTDSTSPDFYDWAEAHLEEGREYKANVLFDGKNKIADSNNPPRKKPTTNAGVEFPCFLDASADLMEGEYRSFLNWLRQYATFKGWTYNERQSMGYKIVQFTKR